MTHARVETFPDLDQSDGRTFRPLFSLVRSLHLTIVKSVEDGYDYYGKQPAARINGHPRSSCWKAIYTCILFLCHTANS